MKIKGMIPLLFVLILLTGCQRITDEEIRVPMSDNEETEEQIETVKQLQEAEVREYEGEKLDTVVKFRENSIKGVQFVELEDYKLRISGLVDDELSLTYDEVLDFQKYSKVVTLFCVEGWDVKVLWEGVLLKDLFEEAGIKEGANTVVFYAEDGYSSSLGLDYVLDNDIMLAYKINDVILPPRNGFPFQVVAEDKWGYKWVKWVTRIELSDDPNYKGTYEKAGYSVKGDVDGPKFD